MSEHPTTIITPSALFSHSRIMSPIPSKYSSAPSINQLVNPSTGQTVMLGTPPYTFQSFPSSTPNEFFHSPAHTFVLPYVATAPHLALDESLDGSVDDEEWIGYDGSKTPDFIDENSNPSTPYFVESDLSTISDDRSVNQQYDEADYVEPATRPVERSITFPTRASIFEEPQTVIQSIKQSINQVQSIVPDDLPQLEAVPYEPASRTAYQPGSKSVIETLKSSKSSKSSDKSSKKPSINIPSSQSVVEYSSDMSRSLAIVKGTRSFGDLQSLKKWSKHKSKKGPKKASGQGEPDNQQNNQQNQQHNDQQNNQQNNQTPGGDPNNGQGNQNNQDPSQNPFGQGGNNPMDNGAGGGAGGAGDGGDDKKKKRGSGGKRKRDSDDSGTSDDDSSSEEEIVDEHGNKIKRRKDKSKRLKAMSKRERNKLSAKAYRQRKKNATGQLSEKNIALQRVVDQQVRMLADAQLEAERMKEQLGVLQSLLSVKISDLWQSRPKVDLPPMASEQQSSASASSRPTGSGSPLAPIVPPLGASISPSVTALHSPETSGFPSFAALQASVQQGSALAMREGEEFKLSSLSQQPSTFGQPPFMPQPSLMPGMTGVMPQPGVLNQRTGMFLLALFSCFLLFNPGSRRSADTMGAMPPPHPGHEDHESVPMSMDSVHQSATGVLSALAEAAIKSESDTSPTVMHHPGLPSLAMNRPSLPVAQPVKSEPMPMHHDQMAHYLAQTMPGEFPQVRIPLLVDAQGVLHEWLVTADEHAMAQMRALTYEPLVRALGQDIANRAIREFAASFARQLG